MRVSCPSSQVTANERPLTIKLSCAMSTIASQYTADFGDGSIDARCHFAGEFFELRVIHSPQRIRADLGPRRLGSLQPGDGTLKSRNGFFELFHVARLDSGLRNRADRSAD